MPSLQSTPWPEKIFVAAVLALYLALAITFSLGPILEAPDEPAHYTFTRNLILTRHLPDPVAHLNVQDHQAPLYYVLLIPVDLMVDNLNETVDLPPKNPFWGAAMGSVGNDNKNLRLHSRTEDFPYSAYPFAATIHALRLVSVLVGLATVVFSYLTFRLIWPDNLAYRLMGLGAVAFWPQFVWLSSVLNNDNLLILTATISLYLTVKQLKTGPSWKLAVVYGLALGAALLSKASAVFLAFPVGVGILLDRRSWRYAPVTLAISLLLAGWWYARNVLLMHTLAGWPPSTDPGLVRPGGLALDVAISRLPFAYGGFWARFGNVSVPVDDSIYTFYDAVSLLSLAGLAWWAASSTRSAVAHRALTTPLRDGLVMLAFTLAGFVGLVYNAATLFTGNQGRYALTSVSGWAWIIAVGLLQWVPARFKTRVAVSGNAILAAITSLTLAGYYFPAFKPLPPPRTVDSALVYRFGDVAELTGVSPAFPGGKPGDTVTITLVWKALRPSPGQLVAYLHSVESDIVRRDSYPATGNLLATDWQSGQVWAERYVVAIPPNTPSQAVYPLIVGLYDAGTKRPLPAVDASGASVTPIVGRFAIHGDTAAPLDPDYRFADVIGMSRPQVTRTADQIRVCLRWVSVRPVSIDYHVFVHILDADNHLLTQADFEPKLGRYPTSAWLPRETVDDCAVLDASSVPETGWQVATGLYDVATGNRLPVTDRTGKALENGMIKVQP